MCAKRSGRLCVTHNDTWTRWTGRRELLKQGRQGRFETQGSSGYPETPGVLGGCWEAVMVVMLRVRVPKGTGEVPVGPWGAWPLGVTVLKSPRTHAPESEAHDTSERVAAFSRSSKPAVIQLGWRRFRIGLLHF